VGANVVYIFRGHRVGMMYMYMYMYMSGMRGHLCRG
jgi:hypothetical protein